MLNSKRIAELSEENKKLKAENEALAENNQRLRAHIKQLHAAMIGGDISFPNSGS